MKYLLILFTCISFGQFNPIFFNSIISKNNYNQGIIAYFKFDNSTVDNVNGNNGTYVNPTTYGIGKINQALQCATNRYMTIPYTSNYSFSNGSADIPFSISFWAIRTASADVNFISRMGGSGATDEFEISRSTTNGIKVVLYSNSTSAYIEKYTNSAISNAVFSHIVVTYDGTGIVGGIKIYVNNVLQATTDSTVGTYTFMPVASQLTYVGRFYNGTKQFDNRIDELGIWKNKVLTVSEISHIYNSGTGIQYPF